VSVLLADMASAPLQDTAIPLLNGLIPIVTLFACELIISGGMLSSIRFRELMCGRPSFLIVNGKIQEKEMRKARLSIDELFEELRSKEILDINTVQYAVLETDGTLSTILEPEERPLTPKQMNSAASDAGYPVIIISDGELLDNNLVYIGKSKRWLRGELEKQGAKSEDEVFIMIYYENRGVYLQKKEADNA